MEHAKALDGLPMQLSDVALIGSVDFIYNVGVAGFNNSAVKRHLKSLDYAAAGEAVLNWRYISKYQQKSPGTGWVYKGGNRWTFDCSQYINGQRIITGFSPEEKGIDVHKYIRTDILIDTGGKESKIIIDTKYKNANKIASSDIYQMLAYGKIHNTKNLCLIYPKVDKEYSCNACFSPEIDAKLAVIAIDLSQELKNINVSKQISNKFVLY